jgi:hypothetical protein
MNGTAGGTVNSMDAKEVAGLQAAGGAASTAGGPNPDSINVQPLNQQQQHGGDAPAGLEQALAQAAAGGQGGSFAGGMGGQGGGSTLGAEGGALGAMVPAGGAGAGGSMVVGGGDNSAGNVNKKLFVKRSCTEAMLKVGCSTGCFFFAAGLSMCIGRLHTCPEVMLIVMRCIVQTRAWAVMACCVSCSGVSQLGRARRSM